MKNNPTLCLKVLIAGLFATQQAYAATYAPWLTQIGMTDSIASAANWGKNQVLGVVDTGIALNYSAFATGQISQTLSGCAAVTFRCSNGVNDDNSHGTAVAEIAAGNRTSLFNSNYGGYTVTAGSYISVAPNANIVAEKVLNSAGSGYSTDVANGIRKAADAGAGVINVSITYGNTADIVSAINYAASKGAFIVWAGGNSAVNLLSGANTSGLTASAISHLVFAGSVNSQNVLSSFSNKPGTGSLVDTSGQKTAYSVRWLVAPGENILAPIVTSGANAWGYWSGTSMSTPIISGSMLLLQSAWPILKTQGTTANLLLATATDLGAKGTDSSYGVGEVNLTTAFKPYGTLSVTQANGKSIATTSITGSLISSGALGSLSSVQSKLANYTAFDSYARNFSVDLSRLISSPSATATLNALPTNVNTGPTKVKLVDGGELAYYQAPEANPLDRVGLLGNPSADTDSRIGYAMFNDKAGRTTAFGYGFPAQYSYARALYGNEDFARLSSDLSALNLTYLAQGGGLLAYGFKCDEATRVAVSFSNTITPGTDTTTTLTNYTPEAAHISAGVAHQWNKSVSTTVTFSSLNEQHGLLGSSYDSASALSLGNQNNSNSVGFSSAFNLDKNNTLLLENTYAVTEGAQASGLFAGTSSIVSTAYGATWMSRNLMKKADQFKVALFQPLRVSSGKLGLVTQTVDELGYAHSNTEWVSLAPAAREIDLKVSYDTPLNEKQSLSLQTTLQKDALNVAGNNKASIGATWYISF